MAFASSRDVGGMGGSVFREFTAVYRFAVITSQERVNVLSALRAVTNFNRFRITRVPI